jgi:hypothetical protein
VVQLDAIPYIAGGLQIRYLNSLLIDNPVAAAVPGTEFAVGEIEIPAPSESAARMERTFAAYLEAGVSEVWVIYPDTRHLFVHTTSGARLCGRHAVLDTPLLPGWSLQVNEIFRD